MNPIGFKITDNKLSTIENPQEEETDLDVDDLIRQKGTEKILEVVSDYCHPRKYPLLSGKKRDEWIVDRLSKIRERYFESI